MSQILTLLFSIFSAAALAYGSPQSGWVKLAWYYDIESERDLADFRVYYGTSPDDLPLLKDAGKDKECVVEHLDNGTTYYFVAKAYTNSGLASGPSNLLLFTVPAVPEVTSISTSKGPAGTTVTIMGENLEGAKVNFNNTPSDVLSNTSTEVVVIVPPGASSGAVTVTTFGGVAAAGDFTIAPAVSDLELDVPAFGVATAATIGSATDATAGYATAALESGSVLHGTAVLKYRQGGAVVSEVAIPESPVTRAARILVDYRTKVSLAGGSVSASTAFAAVNRGADTAHLKLTLRDKDGVAASTGTMDLEVKQHIAAFMDQYPSPLTMPAGFTDPGFGSLDIQSDQPISVMGLRMMTDEQGAVIWSNAPVADLSSQVRFGPVYIPYLADGGGYQATLFLFNATSYLRETGTIEFKGVNLSGDEEPSTQVRYDIAPGAALRLVTAGSQPEVKTGWASLVPDPGTPTPEASVVLTLALSGEPPVETVFQAIAPSTHLLVYVDEQDGYETALALANPAASSTRLNITAYRADGTKVYTGFKDVGAGSHEAEFLRDLVRGVVRDGFKGVLEISGEDGFVALALRTFTNSRGNFVFSAFPVADLDRPQAGTSIQVFPQLADGDGYAMEFVFLGGVTESTVDLSFLAADGTPLHIGIPP